MLPLRLIRPFAIILCACAFWAATISSVSSCFGASAEAEEKQLINILNSSASAQQKDAACARLKLIGTSRCISSVANLLEDDQLSDSARYVLEPMQDPKAGKALAAALSRTTGKIRIGIIDSLGVRKEASAVSALSKLLDNSDAEAGGAAAQALGKINSKKALAALLSALPQSSGRVRAAVVDGCLDQANRLSTGGNQNQAAKVFRTLLANDSSDHVRAAAFRGLVLSSGETGLTLMLEGLNSPGPEQAAALGLVHELKMPGVTARLCSVLPKLPTETQAALAAGLGQRWDPVAIPALIAALESNSGAVRMAAVQALGLIGGTPVVRPLLLSACSSEAAEQAAARQALANLKGNDVSRSLANFLQTAEPKVQAEAARALGERGENDTVSELLRLAATGQPSSRTAALQALSRLGTADTLVELVNLVVDASEPSTRAQAVEALMAASQRLKEAGEHFDTKPLLDAAASAPIEAQIALLPVASGVADENIRGALRDAVASADPGLQKAGVQAMSDSIDPELLPDLARLACDLPDPGLRMRALRGCVRLATEEGAQKVTTKQRVELLGSLLRCNTGSDHRRAVLAGLAEIPDSGALRLASDLLDEPAVANEAAQAVIKIAASLDDVKLAIESVSSALSKATDPDTQKRAKAALAELEARADYITAWQGAGPFSQNGKTFAELFDIPFPPEKDMNASEVKWSSIPSNADPKRPWIKDLLKQFGGEQRVAYARAWVHSPAQQTAVLELGSDDGVKVWLNSKLIHANNASRALQPGSDKVNLTLLQGWNSLLLKITQNNQGWEFCAKLVRPDGTRAEGLRFSAEPPANN